MKKILILLSIFLLILTGCQNQNSSNDNNPESNIKNTSLSEKTNDSKIVDEALNFKIEIPDSLLKYHLVITHDDKTSVVNINTIYAFQMHTTNTNWPNKAGFVDFLKLQIYNLNDWQRLLDSGNYVPPLIKTTSDYVYAYSKNPVLPPDIEINFDDVDKIIESFTLLIDNEIPDLTTKPSTETPQGD